MTAYYNELDPFAAAWLRELIADGVIAPGDVDTRSIAEVQPDDLRGYTQCHFFAGIGGWSYAARLAGLPDDFPLWTGSCPCQPFSAAGKQQGEADHRHLWPEFRRLIAQCRPAIAVGEQVASALGRDWLTGVRADLEALGYAVGAADLCAASAGEEGEGWIMRGDQAERERLVIGAPHIRQRLFWVADTQHAERGTLHINGTDGCDGPNSGREETYGELGTRSQVCGLADAERGRCEQRDPSERGVQLVGSDEPTGGMGDSTLGGLGIHGGTPGRSGHPDQPTPVGGVGDSLQSGLEGLTGDGNDGAQPRRVGTGTSRPAPSASDVLDAWADFTLLPCRDGKTRRTQSGLFPLVDGPPRDMGPGGDPRRPVPPDEANATAEARVNRLRGYGNAIVPQVAALFLRAYLEAR